jgi:hypothetical protein
MCRRLGLADHLQAGIALDGLGDLLIRAGKPAEAASRLNQAVRILSTTLGDEAPPQDELEQGLAAARSTSN